MCALLCSCHHYTPKICKKQQILNKFEKISNTFEAGKAELTARLEEPQAAEPERDIKRIPVLSKALNQYWGLDSEDRNRLLKGMAERVEYEKTERGTGVEPTPARNSQNLNVYHLVHDL